MERRPPAPKTGCASSWSSGTGSNNRDIGCGDNGVQTASGMQSPRWGIGKPLAFRRWMSGDGMNPGILLAREK
jgi:hypothetical protein